MIQDKDKVEVEENEEGETIALEPITGETEDITDYLVTIGGRGESGGGRGVEVTPIGRKNDTVCRISDPFGGKEVREPSAVYTSLGIVVCGGTDYSEYDSKTCTRLDTSNNSWVPFPSLTRPRFGFTMNDFSGKVLAIGGYKATTSEYIKIVKKAKWIEINLQLNIAYHCSVGIAPNKIIITGGHQHGSSSRNTSFVTYSSEVDSWEVTSGPMMKQARYKHGCAVANFKGSLTAFVVGGHNGNDYLDSVEVLDLKDDEWKTLHSKLPFPLLDLQVVTARSLKYHIYAVGGFTYQGGPVATIYGLNTSVEWEHVDDLKHTRSRHSTINMQLKDIPGCQ